MDDADFLLAVASSDRLLLYQASNHLRNGENVKGESTDEMGKTFTQSEYSAKIKADQEKEWRVDWLKKEENSRSCFEQKYQNSFLTSVWLNFKRAYILWTRDKIFIRASVIKNIAMGLTVGAVFFNTELNSSYFGILFQGNLFIMLGAMAMAPEKINERAIFYKHDDSNFYPATAYVIGQALAFVPQMIIDVVIFGTFVYWMVGFVAGGFILYLVLFFSFNFVMGQMSGLLAAIGPNKNVVQAGGALLLLLNTLFCGFIVAPTVIPPYYIWLYWSMPLAWVYRALLLNEYTSSNYDGGLGSEILESNGFMHHGEPFGREWIGYCFAYLIPFVIICMLSSIIWLHYHRVEPKKSKFCVPESMELRTEDKITTMSTESSSFTPVTMTFNNLSYQVKSSVGEEEITLLNNISGLFYPGRMCALMGESGE